MWLEKFREPEIRALPWVRLLRYLNPHRSLSLLAEVIFKGDSTGQGGIDIERVHAEWEFDPRFSGDGGPFSPALWIFQQRFSSRLIHHECH